MEPTTSDDSTTFQRYMALKLLRENMLFSKPTTYNATDFAEDIPGPFRSVGAQFNDVLPSLSIISKNDEERRGQIRAAIQKIKASKQSKSELGKQILHNAATMGLGSLPIGFALSSAFHLMGFRGMKSQGGHWRSPVTPIKNTGKLFSQPKFRKNLLQSTVHDSLIGAGMGAAAGTAYPLLAHNTHISDRALYDAAGIMQKHPYITSLPVSDMISVIEERKEQKRHTLMNRLKNVGIGAGVGVGIGAVGAFAPAAIKAPFIAALRGLRHKPMGPPVRKLFSNAASNDMIPSALMMGAVGGTSGLFTNNIIKDENQKLTPY